jgi:chromosomal replication initiator protein
MVVRRALKRLRTYLAQPTTSGKPFPVLFLHGPSGTGKSHLLSKLVQDAINDTPERLIQVVSASELDRIFIDVLTTTFDSGTDPLQDLRECDLLIIEDLQHFPGRCAEGLTNLLDDRKSYRRCSVLSAQVGPAHLKQLPRRLTSRFAGGLVVQTEPIGVESKTKLVRQSLRDRNLQVTTDVEGWLVARALGGSIRGILGTLTQLETLTKILPPPMDLPGILDALQEPELSPVSPLERIASRICAHYQIETKMLRSTKRHRHLLWPRQVTMYIARQITKLSLVQIGEYFGGKDHSTVLHACRKVEEAIDADSNFAIVVRQLCAEIG